ncbi:NADH:flavin oxidoreductase [Desulfosediminicola ganghwensis]|uniref:NADH:flavin oxidoreductase n=1 Tax=Desulfosediminicola ganghwensis TaxID=2569540 RepID=UPI0010AC5491|nr:NADH:flavin oxidoreductase [Desulfosediminicola ganghwensis]
MKTLFDKTTIGTMTLKNRLWRSATWENMADEKGHLTDRLRTVYRGLAQGGIGTIITGYAFVLEDEQPNPGMMGIYDDSFISEYKELTTEVQAEGANIVMQIVYGGSSTGFNIGERDIMGPSAVANPSRGVVPREMTRDDIVRVVEAFAQAARRCKAAGFDGVQIHGAHGYLLSQFLSPYFNRRKDEYGGEIHNRARIIYETLEAVRATVGLDYPVFIKMHCTDHWDSNGLSVEDSLQVALELQRRGITGIEFSGGNPDADNYPGKAPIRNKIIAEEKQSYFAIETAQIAEKLVVPVISVGGHRSPTKMKELLNTTSINYFAMSRTLLSEPDLPNRWQRGDFSRPRCVSCGKCWDAAGNICILDRKKNDSDDD